MDSDGLSDPYCMLCLSKSKVKGKLMKTNVKSKQVEKPKLHGSFPKIKVNQKCDQPSPGTSKERGKKYSLFSPLMVPKTGHKRKDEKRSELAQSLGEKASSKSITLTLTSKTGQKISTIPRSSDDSGFQTALTSATPFSPISPISHVSGTSNSSPATSPLLNISNANSCELLTHKSCNYSKHEQVSMLKRAKLLQKYVMQEKVQRKQKSLPTPNDENEIPSASKTDTTTTSNGGIGGNSGIRSVITSPTSGDAIGVLGPDGLIIYRTRVVHKSLSPIWNETFHLYESNTSKPHIFLCVIFI